jgi:hypothetical protein
MRDKSWVAALAALALFSPSVPAAEKLDIRVLYAGNPGSARAKDFVSFLRQHFAEVRETNYEKFQPAEANGSDVVIFDWTSIYPRDKDGKVEKKFTGMHSPKTPRLSADFARPAILIGAAGGQLAGTLKLKIDWL